MKNYQSLPLLLIGGGAILALTGCGQIEQAATEVVDKAKQSAAQVIDDAKRAGSLDQVKEAANQALQEVRQQAAGVLGEASEYLSEGERQPLTDDAPAEHPESAL